MEYHHYIPIVSHESVNASPHYTKPEVYSHSLWSDVAMGNPRPKWRPAGKVVELLLGSSKPMRTLSGSHRAHVPSSGLLACRSSKAIDPWADELWFHGECDNY